MDTRCHPGPSLSPSTASKLPAGRQTGRLPSYCQGGQGKGRMGWGGEVRCYHTHTQEGEIQKDKLADRQKRKGMHPPATKEMQTTVHTAQICPLTDSHTLSQFRSITQGVRYSQTYKHTGNRHRLLQNSKHTQLRIYTFPDSQGQIQLSDIYSQIHTHTYICMADTHNSQVHRYTCPDSQIYTCLGSDTHSTHTHRYTF